MQTTKDPSCPAPVEPRGHTKLLLIIASLFDKEV